MKINKLLSASLAALMAFTCLPITSSADGVETVENELLKELNGGTVRGVDSDNVLLADGYSNSYLRVDNQPLGNCILTVNLATDTLSPDEKYILAFKTRAQVDPESFRGIRYTVANITRKPVSPLGEEWVHHISAEFSVSSAAAKLTVNFQGDANYFSVNPYDLDDLGVYRAKKDESGNYILDDTTAVFYNDFDGEGDSYTLSNSCAQYADIATETEYLRLEAGAGGSSLSVGGVKLEAGTYILKGDARMSYFFNGALDASTPDTRHTYTEADSKGVVHAGDCADCGKFAAAEGDVKDKTDAKYKLARHLIFGNPSDVEKYRDTSLYNEAKASYHHIIYTWESSSKVFGHANYRSLTASAVGRDEKGNDVSIGAVFYSNKGTDDGLLDFRYEPVSADRSSIDITDDWSSFVAVFTVTEAMTLESLIFGGADVALDFDSFDVRSLSLKRGDPDEALLSSGAPIMTDRSDISEENYMETHFNTDGADWAIDPAFDKVSGGAMTLTATTPTRNVTHAVKPGHSCEIEFRMKITKAAGECGFKYEWNGQRIFMMFHENNTAVFTADGSAKSLKIDTRSAYHTYKLKVTGSSCDIYLDGDYQFTYNLVELAKPKHNDRLSFFVNSAVMDIDYVIFETVPASITLVPPSSNITYVEGGSIALKSICDGDALGIPGVDYYANGMYIGTASEAEGYTLNWKELRAGTYHLQAKYGEHISEIEILNVDSNNSGAEVTADREEYKAGELITLGLTRTPRTMKNVTYYVGGKAIEGSIFTADTLGRSVISARIEYNDGSYIFTDNAYITVTSESTDVKLQKSYIAEYKAAEGARITASDGMFALDITHSEGGVTYMTSDGAETYNTGLGDYRVQADGGICDVYYMGQFAFSFRMPMTAENNGFSAISVDGLALSGINATLAEITDNGAAHRLPKITQKYAAEFRIDGRKDFDLVISDGSWETNLKASGGSVLVNTYPNLTDGMVETETAFTLDDDSHICRITAVNGIGQIFIDNKWVHSFRMPLSFTVPYASAVGTGTVLIRETNDLYIYRDSFDGMGELDSAVYWDAKDGVSVSYTDGAMVLTPVKEEIDPNANTYSASFDSHSGGFTGDGFSIKDGVMVISNSDPSVSKNILASVEASDDFILEVRARVTGFGAETGMKLEYPTNRIMMYFYEEGKVMLCGKDTNLNAKVDTKAWHTYKFVVTDTDKCEMFIDGVSCGKIELMARSFRSNVIGFFSKPKDGGATTIEVDSVLYVRNDAVSAVPEAHVGAALIKASALDPTVSAAIKVDSADKGGVYLTARYDSEYRNLLAGYDFIKGAWVIVRTLGEAEVLAEKAAGFPFGEEVRLGLALDGENAVLYVNGEAQLTTDKAEADHYGQVGIVTSETAVKVLEYSYEGTSRPIPGALTFINDTVTPQIFEYEKDHIIMVNGSGGGYESFDDGITWEKNHFGKYSEDTVKLASGTIVYVVRTKVGEGESYINYSYVSTDGGNTFEGPYPIQSYARNRITMNCKLTEASNGRLFFTSGEGGHGVEDEGGFRVFYSDDEGRTWKGANMLALDGVTVVSGGDEARMDLENTGVNAQECRVVEMPDGTFRLYGRTDEGFLYYSESSDNGETWTAKMHASEFPTVLSAFQVVEDPYNGDYYAAWEYNAANDHGIGQRPRNRVALAVSHDGLKTWEYVGDVHISTTDSASNTHFNVGLDITEDAVYADVVHSTYIGSDDGSVTSKNLVVRVDKSVLKSSKRWSSVVNLAETAPNNSEKAAIDSALVLSADGDDILANGRVYAVSEPIPSYVPANIMAGYVGAAYSAEGSTVRMTAGKAVYSFNAGSNIASVGDTAVPMSYPAVSGADGVMIPVTALREVFGRTLTSSSNGAWISFNRDLAKVTFLTEDSMAGYLPVDAAGLSASELNRPDAWAVPEVESAASEGIVPASVRGAYRRPINREEFCELIMTMLTVKYGASTPKELCEKLGFTYKSNFTDTDKPFVIAANCMGIINGRGNGIFDPDSGITRQEAAVMLANAAGVIKIVGGEPMTFADIANAAEWARSSIESITSIVSGSGSRIMGGVGNDMFDPLGAYSRQQAILTVLRLYMC